jgi:Ca-activated chloride channel homolog
MKMIKLSTALLAAVLLPISGAWAQNSQDLPSAPIAAQPRFPGAPAQPAPQEAPQPAPSSPPGDATPLTTLPPAYVPPAPAEPQSAGQNESGQAEAAAADQEATKQGAQDQEATKQETPKQEAPKPEAQKPSGSAPATAQAPPNEEAPEGEFRIGVEVDLVNLIFTATDKHGRFIKNLKQEDVRLLDEGKPPERIEAFESETGLPLRVGLLIDASNSIRDRFRFEQDSAVEFLTKVVRQKSDEAFVIGFDSVADLTQDNTDKIDALARGVRVLRPGGGTALHDAVLTACEKLAKAPVRGPARRAIILLSDGDDNQSRHSREEAIEAALRAEVIIYVISTDATDSNRKGDKILTRYAESTGGRVFFPLRLEEVASAFAQIQDELRSQYVLAYKPQNFVEDGRYRAISIDVPKRSEVKIRARKGYYAPKAKP